MEQMEIQVPLGLLESGVHKANRVLGERLV